MLSLSGLEATSKHRQGRSVQQKPTWGVPGKVAGGTSAVMLLCGLMSSAAPAAYAGKTAASLAQKTTAEIDHGNEPHQAPCR